MTAATAICLATTLWVGFALAQTRQIVLVKNSPINYGTNGFDISWVDNSTQKYYLADRTNNTIDFVDAATDTFLGFIGKGQYTGTKRCPGQPKDLRHCAGPNGVAAAGSLFGSANIRKDIPKLLELYQKGQLDLDSMVTATYPLSGINEGYQDMRDGKNIRGVLLYS